MKDKMINDWAPETKDLLQALIAANFVIRSGDNGEEKFKFNHENLDGFIANLIACDESTLYVVDPSGRKLWLHLVLGNEPGILASDYCIPSAGTDHLDALLAVHYLKWSGLPQPMKPSPR